MHKTHSKLMKAVEPITNPTALTASSSGHEVRLPVSKSCQPLCGLKSRAFCNVRGSKVLELSQAASAPAGANTSTEPGPLWEGLKLPLLGYQATSPMG